jgi:hypothetical protein
MTAPQSSRARRVLVVILGILACVAITLSATTLWLHQAALNTDRYVSIVTKVAADPEVVEEVSTNLAERLVSRIEIPQLVKPLIQDWLQERIATFMESEGFADAWANANRAAHTALVRILRSDAVLPEEPVTISIRELLVIGVERLQEVGVIPGDIELPDLSDNDAVQRIREVLAERLDVELPEDFGQITIVRPARLEMARQFVRIFDFITVTSVLLTVGLIALTIFLARNRLRAVLLLGIGAAVALLAAIAATGAISSAVAGALAEAGARGTLGAMLSALMSDLAVAFVIVLVIGAVTVLAIQYVGRQPSPAAAMAVASPYPAPFPPPAAEPEMREAAAPAAVLEPPSEANMPTATAAAKPPARKPRTKPPAKRATAKPSSTKPPAKKPAKAPPTNSS